MVIARFMRSVRGLANVNDTGVAGIVFFVFFTLLTVATSAWAQDIPSPAQIAHAADICEKEFMVSCTPGGDQLKERCFTVPGCYKVVRRAYSDL